ncbi:conserved hypothetical protein [Candida dubliniensis CD36]|uniref:Uncharacterized protein n=1 Tax=Candida dubliniensis (strain CD36 / ATCC MYA-646 / CBS 7987 / NCPF 3949 / NRRL Y-17841) TaxID=573826 RepID=B9WFJ7_CANDC|nr:conserved hypothetical protein [Candida dubliniensis CD36]CAX42016.1 conserved hypothetical protein [Candida dubliniensis CD36]
MTIFDLIIIIYIYIYLQPQPTIKALIIPKSIYNITYQGININNVRNDKSMYEFKVIGGPYKTNVNYYYDSFNGIYFINQNQNQNQNQNLIQNHHNNNSYYYYYYAAADDDNDNDIIEVLSRDEIGIQLNEKYNSLFL